MYEYRCEVCGCYLDPGEGRICEDCLREDRRKPVDMFGQLLAEEHLEPEKAMEDLR